MWGTNAAGTGTSLVEVSIDGGEQTTLSHTSNGTAVYNVLYYNSSIIPDTLHQLTVTNRGSPQTGYTFFLLDRFEFETDRDVPIYPTSSTQTLTATSSVSTLPESSTSTSDVRSRSYLGAIAGSVIGVLAFLVLVLSYLLWRRMRKSSQVGSKIAPRTGEFKLKTVVY